MKSHQDLNSDSDHRTLESQFWSKGSKSQGTWLDLKVRCHMLVWGGEYLEHLWAETLSHRRQLHSNAAALRLNSVRVKLVLHFIKLKEKATDIRTLYLWFGLFKKTCYEKSMLISIAEGSDLTRAEQTLRAFFPTRARTGWNIYPIKC